MEFKHNLKHLRQKITKQPFVFDFIGKMAALYVRLVGKTSDFSVKGLDEFEKLIQDNNGAIFVAWHGRALMLPFFWRNTRQMKALVSPHNDGRIIAKLLKDFNILSIDGSSNRNAKAAALDIVRELEKGNVVALISDGPRGPRMRLNKSVIYFAQKTGKPIMGFTYSAKNASVMEKSWDQMIVPKPFSKGAVVTTKPLFVPKNVSEEQMEKLRADFEDELNSLTIKLDENFKLPAILPADVQKLKR